jgi:hypothetical protein
MARIARVVTFFREGNVNIYLQGRKITTAQDHQRSSVEVLPQTSVDWNGGRSEAG